MEYCITFSNIVVNINNLQECPLVQKGKRNFAWALLNSQIVVLVFGLNFQICDFGLAKWLPASMTHHQVTTFEGTFGSVSNHQARTLQFKCKINVAF